MSDVLSTAGTPPTPPDANASLDAAPDVAAASTAGATAAADHASPDVAVLRPGDDGWDQARTAWNLAVDLRPAAVAVPGTPAEVAAAVRWANQRDLRIAPISTGHNPAALPDLADCLLLRMHRLRSVRVDVDQRLAHVSGGAVWQDVTSAVAPHGLVALAGSSPDVGVSGYLLGGGISWLGREFGLAANSVVSIDVVTADGQTSRADPTHEPELFWALRGGAANLGIVTGLTIGLLPVVQVVAGSLFWPAARASEILGAFDAWTRTVPDTVTSCARLMHVPDLPDLPPPVRGRSFVVVDGAIHEEPDVAARLLAGLRERGPEIDTWAPIPAAELSAIHLDPPTPVPAAGDGLVLDALPPAAITALVDLAGDGSGTPLLTVDLRHLGGALGRPDPAGGAVDHLAGRYGVFAVGMAPDPVSHAAVTAAVAAVKTALAPWASTHEYLNFSESRGPASRFFGDETLARLRRARRTYDPHGRLVANHSLDD